MKCVPKWYLRLDFTFKSSKVAIFFGQISEISFQSHLIFIIQSFRNFEAGYIWKFICYEVRFGKVRFGSVKITGPVRFGKSGICLVRSTTVDLSRHNLENYLLPRFCWIGHWLLGAQAIFRRNIMEEKICFNFGLWRKKESTIFLKKWTLILEFRALC